MTLKSLPMLLASMTFLTIMEARADGLKVAPDCAKALVDWVPTNQPSNRWSGSAAVPDTGPADLPAYIKEYSSDGKRGFVRHGIVFGPNEKFQAAFNPASWVVREKDGTETVMLLIRGEEERPGAEWKRHSLPYLASSKDGIHFKLVQENPIFEATEWYEKKGGVEDPRYFDMRLSPYTDPADGRSFDGAILYVAYDGTTPRVAAAYFNHDNTNEYRKGGLVFNPKDVRANPIVPGNPEWNKSAGAIQYRDPKSGKVRNVVYVGEGNAHHGGIMAIESDSPLGWKWPKDKKPVLHAKPGTYTQSLVEVAFPPVIGPLPADLARKTGQRDGIYVHLHGDANPSGYQVGYAIFSLADPTGAPLYESKSPFLKPEMEYEKEGQVGLVVFASGGVKFTGQDGVARQIIYYGGADRVVGAASAELK